MNNLQITARITPRDNRSVNIYLKDIARHPLLSVDEEVELARRIHAGDERALERMVTGNLRFVVSVAKKYQNMGLDFPDLISAGNIGLITAARRYNETRGTKFCSYAIWWIQQSILRALDKEIRTVTLPANQQALLSKMNKVILRLEQELQRSPTKAEVADRMKENYGIKGDAEKHLGQLIHASQRTVSLNAPIMDEEDMTLADNLTDPSAFKPDDGLMQESLSSDIESVLSGLHPNERQILKMYFGIGYPHSYSMDEIGIRIGISRERVRQLHNKALLRLQRGSAKERLKAYL